MSNYVPSAVKLREYEKIFMGSNQEEGYENPFFGFVADTTLQVFETDKVIYFHYPITGPVLPLSASGLIEAGAVAGSIPFNSDKVWKKDADYKKYIWWGNSSKPDTGVWLCSWLSGNVANPTSVPVWKDRWYNPGYINSVSATFVQYPSSSVIIDLDSEMTFELGVWYKYQHIGNNQNLLFVDLLTGSNGNLKVHLDNWEEIITTYEEPYGHTVMFTNTANMISYDNVNSLRTNDSCLSLNGTDQECQVVFSSDLESDDRLSYSFWTHVRDWNNIEGNQLVGKNLRGGWATKFNNGFFNPNIVTFDVSGTIAFGNSDGTIYFTKTLPGTSNPVAIDFDSNMYAWIIDNGLYQNAKHLYKIDINGDIVDDVAFSSSVDLKDLVIDGNEVVWVLDSNINSISGFNTSMNCISTVHGLYVKYFTGNNFDTFQLGKLDRNLNIWRYGPFAPGVFTQVDWGLGTFWARNYSTIWYGYISASETGTYDFQIYGDNRIRMWINDIEGDPFLTHWVNTPAGVSSVYMNVGDICAVKFDQYSSEGMGGVVVNWKKPSDSSYTLVPQENFILSGSGLNKIDVDPWGRIYAYQVTDMCVDNLGVPWVIYSNKVYKDEDYGGNLIVNKEQLSAIYIGINVTNIVCDKDNNIWVLDGVNEYLKFTNEGRFITSGTTGTVTSSGIRGISFTNEYDHAEGMYKDFVWFSYSNDQMIYKYDTDGSLVRKISLIPFNISPIAKKRFTSYDWNRKFNYLKIGKKPRIEASVFLGTGTEASSGRYVLGYGTSALSNNDWHHFAFTYDNSKGILDFYVDTVLRTSTVISSGAKIYYNYENSIYIGDNSGKIEALDNELGFKGLHFNGLIDDVRIYNCTLNNSDIWYIYLLKYDYHDINWNMPTGRQNYLEEIERFFKFKLPGAKSQYYNIKLIGLNITDSDTRTMIETIIRDTVKKVAPAYTELYRISWE